MAGPSSSAAKLKVFISYSRRDRAFAEKLLAALEARGLDVLIDRRDLPIAVEFQQELLGFIRQADSVIFIVSRTSTASPWCAWELEQVERLGKRLAPVVIETVEDDRRVVCEGRTGVLQRKHRGQALVTAMREFGYEQLPARVVVPGAVNQAERLHLAPLSMGSDRRHYDGLG